VSLWVRDLDSLEARRLPGTEGASSPFWSPDGRFLAFGVGRVLKKVDLSSGVEQTVTVAPGYVGVGAWNRDGVIVFGTRGVGPMRRVAAGGGPSVELTRGGADGFGGPHSFPYFLPDDRRFLYFVMSTRPEEVGVYVGSIDLTPATQSKERVVAASHGPVFIARSASGSRLLFTRDATLLAQPFDPAQARVTGEIGVIAERVGSSGAYSYFSATDDALVFRTGRASQPNSAQLTWVDRKGVSIGKLGEPMPLSMAPNSIAIAPDGRHAAIMRMETPSPDLWLLELARGVGTRLTFNDAQDIGPVWSPDSGKLAFRSNRLTGGELYETDVIGTGTETPLMRNGDANVPMDWSPDGRFILFGRLTPNNGSDLWALSMDRKQATGLLETPFAELNARFSPDGRWVSYASTESGRSEIYIRRFTVSDGVPSLGRKWRVSTDGGNFARWRSDGTELIFRDRSEDFVAVHVTIQGTEVTTSLPQRLFPRPRGVTSWDMTPDAQRFLLAVQLAMETSSSDPATVVMNWQPR
jgi:Tol biopolymer transport system component